MNDKILFKYRQGIANVTIAGLETKGRWVFNPVSTGQKIAICLFNAL
jgi:hypothetical protein